MALNTRSKTALFLIATCLVGIAIGHIFFDGHVARSRMSKHEAGEELRTLGFFSQFINKRNFLNVIFIKRTWFWTTLSLVLIGLFNIATETTGGLDRVFVGVAEYLTATLIWIIVTQGKYMPQSMSLTDRVLVTSGAECISYIPQSDKPGIETALNHPYKVAKGVAVEGAKRVADTFGISEETLRNYVPLHMHHKYCLSTSTGVQNPNAFSRWNGGLDISGHIFLLFIAICLMWYNIVPVIHRRVESPVLDIARKVLIAFTLGLLAIFWWVYFVTSVFFHSISEKIFALVLAYITEEIIAFVGRKVHIFVCSTIFNTPGPAIVTNDGDVAAASKKVHHAKSN